MEIIKTRIMRGPNYWSTNRHRLIVLTIQLTENENALGEADLHALGAKLEKLKPSLHHLREYTSVLDVVAQAAIEIQCLAGMDCAHAVVQSTAQPLLFEVIFSYTVERAGVDAGKAAVHLVNALLTEQNYELFPTIQDLKELRERGGLSTEEGLTRRVPRPQE